MTMKWHPQEFITHPANGSFVQVYRDYWWIVDKDDQIAIWDGRSPQCNPSLSIAYRFVGRIEGAVGAIQIPLAFIKVDLNDY